ncbi:MAG: ATP-binding cassette domain-containing protein [Holophagales bacterium]|nr:ATP-binding cassette domain-containing protein [Holophagales bacterium]MYD23198.1 ATP-binding cassette domain-containing protein [Holophagales bacterium]MYI33788.1 ATP-binding cassette domain-containing protein [Holophagales bacterium]
MRLRGVSKVYPAANGVSEVTAVDGADLEILEGETLALVGESGCGKSSLLRLLNRMEEPTGGDLYFGDVELSSFEPTALRRRIGYVQQTGGLLPHWTVQRNVGLVPELLGWPKERRQRRTEELLRLVGLPIATYGARYPRELSGGERQRVAVARALAANPPLLLLDEPFGALDAITRADVQQTFMRLRTSREQTAVIVTHDLDEAFLLADRIAVMRRGRLLQTAPPRELIGRPADPYVSELLDRGGNRE